MDYNTALLNLQATIKNNSNGFYWVCTTFYFSFR